MRIGKLIPRLGMWLIIDRGADSSSCTFVAGTARSGTTWLADIINYANDYRYIFEPLNEKRVSGVTIPSRKYLRPDENNNALLEATKRILEGRLRSRWTDQLNRRVFSDNRLIKEVRANLLLGWLNVNFPEMPTVMILRHPCAVAKSYAAQGWHGRTEQLLTQQHLLEDFLQPFEAEIRSASDTFERALFIWAAETLIPLKQCSSKKTHLVFYENLISDPEPELNRLFSFLGKEYDDTILRKMQRPSRTARKKSAVISGRDPLREWQARLKPAQIDRAVNVLEKFGLAGIYCSDPLPNVEAALNIMRERNVSASKRSDSGTKRGAGKRK